MKMAIFFCKHSKRVRVEGLEPPSLAAPDPKSGVSTNFTTPAFQSTINKKWCKDTIIRSILHNIYSVFFYIIFVDYQK